MKSQRITFKLTPKQRFAIDNLWHTYGSAGGNIFAQPSENNARLNMRVFTPEENEILRAVIDAILRNRK